MDFNIFSGAYPNSFKRPELFIKRSILIAFIITILIGSITVVSASIDVKGVPKKRLISPTYWIQRFRGRELFDKDTYLLQMGSPKVKEIALTFDDGPHPTNCPKLLKVLEEYNVKATFFIVGTRAKQSPNLIKAINNGGHELANHTHDHIRLTTLNDKQIRHELNDTRILVEKICGKRLTLFRPPGGDYDDNILRIAKSLGFVTVLWTVNTGDWKIQSSQKLASKVINSVDNGGIVLMHDAYDETSEALPTIIETLKSEGYKFVTVSELLRDVHNIDKE